METFLTRKIEYQKSNYMAGTAMKSISRKKVPIVQLSNGWKWQSQGLKGRTARKGWKSSCRSCQRRAANLTQKLKHIWEPIMKEAQQKTFILCNKTLHKVPQIAWNQNQASERTLSLSLADSLPLSSLRRKGSWKWRHKQTRWVWAWARFGYQLSTPIEIHILV